MFCPPPIIPMGLTAQQAFVPPLRPLPDDMAHELFGNVICCRHVALGMAASNRCLAIGLAFSKAPSAEVAAPASPRIATPATSQLPEYSAWKRPHSDDEGEDAEERAQGEAAQREGVAAAAPTCMQVLYSQFPYMHPDPAARMIWPWSAAEGTGWRAMSAAFRSWLAVYPGHVFQATGCTELHLWMDARATWKVVIPAAPDQPARIYA